MDGFGKGAGNILKGVLGGAAIMVTAPIKGTYVLKCTLVYCTLVYCIHVYKCAHVCMYVYVYIHAYVRTYMYTYTHLHVYMCTYIHKRIYTHSIMCINKSQNV